MAKLAEEPVLSALLCVQLVSACVRECRSGAALSHSAGLPCCAACNLRISDPFECAVLRQNTLFLRTRPNKHFMPFSRAVLSCFCTNDLIVLMFFWRDSA